MYASHCEDCGGHLPNLADQYTNWDDIYHLIAEQMNNPNILINADLHLKTAQTLMKAVNSGIEGIGSSTADQLLLIEKLKQNIYAFSAAKSLTQMQYYRDAMIEDGKIISGSAFVKKIADTGEIFNKKFLEAESENAHYSAIMADKWDRFAEEDWLQYSTVGDSRVRPSHAVLDKYTAPKSHFFWKTNYPPNGWSCRCMVVPGKSNYQNKLTDQEADIQLKEENKDSPFYNNVGISKVIFKENHPYFINSKGKEQNLSWQQYGLPNLEKIKTFEDYSETWMNAKGVITEVDFTAGDPKKIDKLRKGILIDR